MKKFGHGITSPPSSENSIKIVVLVIRIDPWEMHAVFARSSLHCLLSYLPTIFQVHLLAPVATNTLITFLDGDATLPPWCPMRVIDVFVQSFHPFVVVCHGE